ncbi:MAG: 3-oxoacyl-ACP reductase FabG [Cytophagia bacterium]|nr:MAG: 3-oxoacyl-ACP reductase FabG [Runella sp.]TAG17091.1 MAG: 3-oxoacyl-ACP reductase FabG [Cytophagales bacterium]TAG36234.1 MAG: 3-oxoacyl-ACP reductase FabG [Cytophagia bacterium]TAG52652.1 MAG: 3-oxoacyl-ACP reductase FabG [Runella slithyformis]TAG77849.1 MAG: 3-oxoacyl-ACP reductase FabG [Cytophagales bacterium]
MGRLESKVAIITGGARGIGRATAEIFGREGAKIIIWDMLEAGHQTAQELRDQGYVAEFMQLSITDVPALEAAARDIFERYGQIDILVNNAGITRDKSLLKMSFEEWHQVIDVNLTGVFNCTKTIVPYMVERQFGRIICTSSVVGQVGNFGQTNYVATKAAIIGMVKTWAKELGKYNITANAVAPGFIKTDMTDLIPEEVRNQTVAGIPVKCMGLPEDIANAYLYLASDEASYVNGHTLSVNGGVA